MSTEAAQKLAELVRDDSSESTEIESALRELMRSVDESQQAGNDVLRVLADLIEIDNQIRGGFIALICGGLVEQGGDVSIIAGPVSHSLRRILPSCCELLTAVNKEMPEMEDEDDEADDDERFHETLESVRQRMPEQGKDWEALNAFWRPAVLVYSLLAEERREAADLRPWADELSEFHEGGHWLGNLLAVLDNEPFIVLDPSRRLGIVGRMSGVADNFQLNTLLMDVFPNPGLFRRRRVSKQAAAIARGEGPQTSDEILTAPWNLYGFQAIAGDKSLPAEGETGSSEDWIWNEGVPADIPIACEKRVILIGPMSYPRSFPSQRLFDKLPASIDIEETLTPEQVDAWVERLRAS